MKEIDNDLQVLLDFVSAFSFSTGLTDSSLDSSLIETSNENTMSFGMGLLVTTSVDS